MGCLVGLDIWAVPQVCPSPTSGPLPTAHAGVSQIFIHGDHKTFFKSRGTPYPGKRLTWQQEKGYLVEHRVYRRIVNCKKRKNPTILRSMCEHFRRILKYLFRFCFKIYREIPTDVLRNTGFHRDLAIKY
jgi:hypothetical protein